MKDVQFEKTRRALQSKQRDLKRKGMGNKPNASAALRQEYLEFTERETKTRSGNDPRNVRAIAPKISAVPNDQKCPEKGLQSLRRKATRGNEIRRPDALFYSGSK
ncbi:unnamed protein product [Pocillopora meandrina]|uniref:Uncharacterized protein n=1 Tax=Pocillopora meandrina TaxID=46732 RepID=A0AAU9Y442_9CNID|nr:unnamed protein product [Pocillopora meandrina]